MTMLIETYQCLLADISEKSVVHLSCAPDSITMNWILVEAPKLDKKLLQWIEDNGQEKPVFPEWLEPLWLLFEAKRREEDLRHLHQLLVFCYKAEFEPTNEQREEAVSQFTETDLNIEVWNDAFKVSSAQPLFREARRLVQSVIYNLNWKDITPSHGPGSVFPGRPPVNKSDFRTLYRKLELAYPFAEFFCGLPSFWWQVIVLGQELLAEGETISCKLAMVPKDSRGPRLISVHPSEAIWIQQGQRRILERAIAQSRLTRRFINLDDQTVNGRLALESSQSKEFVTLDLKEASDRISIELVRYLFGDFAYYYMNASRADSVVLPSGRAHELRKFAPMGNCLTFPVQSLVFWALVQAGIDCKYGKSRAEVYVFGDDIIYPSRYHNGALNGLVRAGLVPNIGKTFRLGSFRESCGVEAFNGIDITPFRLKVASVSSYSNVQSLCSLAKRMRLAGYERCAAYMYSQARSFMGKLHLCNNPDAQGIFEYTKAARDIFLHGNVRFNRKFQRWETPLVLLLASLERPRKDEWYHLQDSLLHLTRMGEADSDRRAEYPIPYRERLKHGWTQLSLLG